MRRIGDLKAAVVGVGFVGTIHVEALRRLGIEVAGVCLGSRGTAIGVPGLPPVYESFEQLLDDPAVDVVHLATPNFLHYPQAKAVLEAGKHCICEKPLALNPGEAGELLALAERSGLVHCTNFNIRFYAQCQEARIRVLRGELGQVRNIHGSYLQDWLLLETDWNWRLEPELGGELRAVADIGSHWLDLAQFVTGRRVTSVFADLATTVPVRARPATAAQTFDQATEGSGVPVDITTEDMAHVLLRFDDMTRGCVVLSQVSAGRRNRLWMEVDGRDGSLAWNSDENEVLWLGHRGEANRSLVRDPSLTDGRRHGSLPGGHAEGFSDSFKYLFHEVYKAVAAGMPGDGEAYPTFQAGYWETVLSAAIGDSSAGQRWVEARSQAGPADLVGRATPG